MLRFIALSLDSANNSQEDALEALNRSLKSAYNEWDCIADYGYFKLFSPHPSGQTADPDTICVLPDRFGAIFGTLFQRDGELEHPSSRCIHIGEAEARRMVQSRGHSLLARYWGRYVAFLHEPANRTMWILRDPSGHRPCLTSSFRGVRVYYSQMDDYARLGIGPLRVNWDYMAARVVAPAIQARETGIEGVNELQPGECHEIRRGTLNAYLPWRAASFARRPLDLPIEQIANVLHGTVRSCVQSWASCYGGVLHRLSGGFDSSVVLSCLAAGAARQTVSCVSYYTESANAHADMDERRYARRVAERAGVPLIETPRTAAARLDRMLQMTCFAFPVIFYDRSIDLEKIESAIARGCGATARFGGEGGDQLFYGLPRLPTVGDILRVQGVGPGLLKWALQVAERDGYSIWAVLRSAIRDGIWRPDWDPLVEVIKKREFITPAARDAATKDARRYVHPCLQDTDDIPLGKLWHIYQLSIPPCFHLNLGEAGGADRVEPLTSQPLLELVLRIPSYVLCLGAQERGLARHAFRSDLPVEILRRRVKGGIRGYIKDALLSNITFVREMLLDGELVRNGLLSRHQLERALGSKSDRLSSDPGELFDYLTMEVWVRTSTRRYERAAA